MPNPSVVALMYVQYVRSHVYMPHGGRATLGACVRLGPVLAKVKCTSVTALITESETMGDVAPCVRVGVAGVGAALVLRARAGA